MADPLDGFRRPSYTGSNRCWPCTIANGVLLGVLVVALSMIGSVFLAGVLALAGLASIALRGYFVPYTPQIAPKLLVAFPLGGPDGTANSLSDTGVQDRSDVPSGETVVTALLEADVLVADGEHLSLDPAFRAAWRREMRTLRDRGLEGLVDEADALTGPGVTTRVGRDWRGRSTKVVVEADGGVATLEPAVAVAELAAARTLESRVDEPIRLVAGRPLRSLLERCPACDGDLERSRSSCCGEVTPVGSTPSEKLFCPDCDVRLFTFE